MKRELYKIDIAFRELYDKIVEQDGEVTPEDLQALEDLTLERDEKIKAFGVVIRELDSDIAEYNAEISRLKELLGKLKKRRESLTNSLSSFMLNNGIPKYESVAVNIRFTTSHPLCGAEQALKDGKLPKEFIRTETTETPDKEAIKAFIKGGGTIENVYIGESKNIQVK